MLIEHTFVTTLEGTQALGLASSFLREMGFAVSPQAAFQIGSTTLTELELTRGKPNKIYPDKCFHQVRLEFDRGRVNLALSILPRPRSAFALSRRTMADLKPSSKRGRPYADLMIALAQSVDELLTQRKTLSDALTSYRSVEATAALLMRRRHRRRRNIAWLIVFVIFALLGLAIYAAATSK